MKFLLKSANGQHYGNNLLSFTTTKSLPLLPNTSGEYNSSALAGGATNVPGVAARAI